MNHIAHRLHELSLKERTPVEEFVMQYCKSKLAPAVIFPPEGNYDREKSVPFPNFYHEPINKYVPIKGLCKICFAPLVHENRSALAKLKYCSKSCRDYYYQQLKLRAIVLNGNYDESE